MPSPASTSVGSLPSRGTLTRAFAVEIATASVFSDDCCRTALSAPRISVRMPPGEVTTPAARSSTTGVRPTAVMVGFAAASRSPTEAAEASSASPSLSTGTVTTSPRSGAERSVLGHRHVGTGSQLRHRLVDLGLEGGDTLRRNDPELACLLVEDRGRAVAQRDLRGGGDLRGVVERDACRIDGGQGRGVLIDDEDVARVLQDVVVLTRGAQATVEDGRLVVEVPDEQARGLGDPDAAVVQIDLGGRESLIGESHRGDGDDADGDAGGRRQRLRSCAHP